MDGALEGPSNCPFVSPSFNLILLVLLGLVFAHSRQLACFYAVCAYLGLLLLTKKQESLKDDSDWNLRVPIVAFAGLKDSEYLVLGLARYVASILWSALVSRVVYSLLPTIRPSLAAIFAGTFFLLFATRALGPETRSFWSRSRHDMSLFFYLLCSHGLESFRGAMQVVLLLSGTIRDYQRKHMLLYSSLIISQNLLTSYSYGGPNTRVTIDILLQIILLLKAWFYLLRNGQQNAVDERDVQFLPANADIVGRDPEQVHCNHDERSAANRGLLKDPLTDEGSFTSSSQAVDPIPSGVCVCGAMVISQTAPYDSEHDYSEPPRNRKMRNRQFHDFNKGVMPFPISGGGTVQPGPIHTAHLLPRSIEVRSNAVGQLVM